MTTMPKGYTTIPNPTTKIEIWVLYKVCNEGFKLVIGIERMFLSRGWVESWQYLLGYPLFEGTIAAQMSCMGLQEGWDRLSYKE